MKQITTLSFCLLFSPLASALQEAPATQTAIPESSVIHEYTATETAPAATAPETSAAASSAVPSAPQENPDSNPQADYRLSPGDGLEISVWKEDGLQAQQYLITTDGTIIFPLIGTIKAAGRTITELKEIITTKLADYISDPSVTVKLGSNLGNMIFVIGKVNHPGQFISSRKIDVLQALSLAGGITVYAAEGSISVLRRVGNEIKVFPFDYDEVISGEHLEQNILLEPGDTVTVP